MHCLPTTGLGQDTAEEGVPDLGRDLRRPFRHLSAVPLIQHHPATAAASGVSIHLCTQHQECEWQAQAGYMGSWTGDVFLAGKCRPVMILHLFVCLFVSMLQ